MKYLASLLFILVTLSAYADDDDDDVPIENSSELREWCKSETEAYFVAEGITPYNWSASWHEEGNTLIVKGSWLIGHDHVAVECRITKGARRKYAVYEIQDK